MEAFPKCRHISPLTRTDEIVYQIGSQSLTVPGHNYGVPCGDGTSGFQLDTNGRVWPVCKKHAVLGFASLADLTAQLGTEVR
jgi:hypothetical protein